MSKGWQIILKAKVEAEMFFSEAIRWKKEERTVKICSRVVEEGVNREVDPVDGKTKFYYGPPYPTREIEKSKYKPV